MKSGFLVWVTGLAGSGKTTLSLKLQQELRQRNIDTILLDGDLLREVTSEDLGYTRQDRLVDAFRKAKLCYFLTNQGFNVICSTISLFNTVHDYNREKIKDYIEILIEVDLDTLARRKPELYSGNIENVWGIDLEPEWPANPTLVLDGNRDLTVNSDQTIELIERRLSSSV